MALRRSGVRIPLGPLAKSKPLTASVERFVRLMFEHKRQLDGLGFELSL